MPAPPALDPWAALAIVQAQRNGYAQELAVALAILQAHGLYDAWRATVQERRRREATPA